MGTVLGCLCANWCGCSSVNSKFVSDDCPAGSALAETIPIFYDDVPNSLSCGVVDVGVDFEPFLYFGIVRLCVELDEVSSLRG